MGIGLFPAPIFNNANLDNSLDLLNEKIWTYASSGRACLFNIIESCAIGGAIALPSVICKSVLDPINTLKLKKVYYDIDEIDLNPSADSLLAVIKKEKPNFALFPSYYGLPANCIEAEKICRDYGVVMIDDAAQSFGSYLDGRRIGTFGDAGFFAFSPGKATSAHCGGFFWTSWPHNLPNKSNHLNHYIQWMLFRYSRLYGASLSNGFSNKIFRYFSNKLKNISNWNADISTFERPILGGVLNDLLAGSFNFRVHLFSEAQRRALNWKSFRLVQSVRGIPHPHKIVLVADNIDIANELRLTLLAHKIIVGRGYPLVEIANTPCADHVSKKIIELPIVNDVSSMDAMFDVIDEYVKLKIS